MKTNEEKAREISCLYDDEWGSFYIEDRRIGAIEMAQWKDENFEKSMTMLEKNLNNFLDIELPKSSISYIASQIKKVYYDYADKQGNDKQH